MPRVRVPVVYECQDILTDCFAERADIAAEERAANEQSAGVIYTNPVALAWAAGRYRLERALSFPNYGSARHFQPRLPKLSAADGRLHLVYCGSVQQTPPGYEYPFARDMKAMFGQIAALGHPLHLHLGLYPGTELARYYGELASVPNIVIHPYQPFGAALRQLTQYDVGLFPVELGSLRPAVATSGESALRAFPLSRADTLKQYEYVLAGLPVLTAPLTWVARWVAENDFGAAFRSVEHLGQLLRGEQVRRWQQAVDAGAGGFAIERQIGALERFLEEVLEPAR
jgi:hypothetical protein